MKCPNCNKEMLGIRNVEFKIGGLGALEQAVYGLADMSIGDLANKIKLNLHFCSKCGKVEFSVGEETKKALIRLSKKQPVMDVKHINALEEIDERQIDAMVDEGYVLNINTGKWEKSE